MPEFTVEIKGKTMLFTTNDKVFSPSGPDRGTCAMLSCVEFLPEDKVLDLGCGYGIVGILAAKLTSPAQVTMCDISEDALTLARKNAAANDVSENIQILKFYQIHHTTRIFLWQKTLSNRVSGTLHPAACSTWSQNVVIGIKTN